MTSEWHFEYDRDAKVYRCPVCRVQYVSAGGFGSTPDWSAVHEHLKRRGCVVEFDDVTKQARRLAMLAMQFRGDLRPRRPPMATLMDVLRTAQSFVHFVSWGIDPQTVGMLRMAARSVRIAGVVSNVGANLRAELTEFTDEVPWLDVRCVPTRQGDWSAPHQKLIVVDGLMAFTGSANLTTNAWRKIADGTEQVDVVTDVARVHELSNTYFSPVWSRFGPDADDPVAVPDPDDVPF